MAETLPQTYDQALSDEEQALLLETISQDGTLGDREDGQEILFMGAGYELTMAQLLGPNTRREYKSDSEALKSRDIAGKTVLVVPGYASNPFMMKLAGAEKVISADASRKSTILSKALAQYWNRPFNSAPQFTLGEVYMSVNGWYPHQKLLAIIDAIRREKNGQFENLILKQLRSEVSNRNAPAPFADISFVHAGLASSPEDNFPSLTEFIKPNTVDTIYTPFLLGVHNGITNSEKIRQAYTELWSKVKNNGLLMVVPFTGTDTEAAQYHGSETAIEDLEGLLPEGQYTIENQLPLDNVIQAWIRVKKG